MKYRTPLSFAATALALGLAVAPPAARADGPEVGEGSWVCRDKSSGNVLWAKGVDLFVMNDETDLNPTGYPVAQGDYPVIVDAIQARIATVEPDFSARLGQALTHFSYLKSGTTGVTYTDDQFPLPNFGFNVSGVTDCDAGLMRVFTGGFYTGSLGCTVNATVTPILISFPVVPNIADCANGILGQSKNGAEDSTVPIVPYETAISYDDAPVSAVHVQQGLWNAFTDADKAAAVVHVAVDSIVRSQYGATDSVLARDLTEVLFAQEDPALTAQRVLILLATAPTHPADDGSGYLLQLKPGVYTNGGGSTLTIVPDTTKQAVTVWGSLFQSTPPPEFGAAAKLDSYIQTYDCSKSGPYQCQVEASSTTNAHLDALTPTTVLLSGQQYQWTGAPLSDLTTLTPGQAYNVSFAESYDFGTPVGSFGPTQLEVTALAADGGPTIQFSDSNPMPAIPSIDPNSDPSETAAVNGGSGLANPASFALVHKEGPLYAATGQPATLTLRNGATCQITPTIRLLYMIDSMDNWKAATVQIKGWPEYVSSLKATQTCKKVPGGFLGLGHKTVCTTAMTESITTCDQLPAGGESRVEIGPLQ